MREIRTYVLRSGRRSERQTAGLQSFLKNYNISQYNSPWNFNEIFGNKNPVVLEIGFGMGDSTFNDAITQPQINIIGSEVHKPGIGNLAYLLHFNNIENVRIFPSDVHIILKEKLYAKSLMGVRIFFPDPWPKKRHHKRRLITNNFINELIPFIREGGWIHCATDWEEYAIEISEILTNCNFLENTCNALNDTNNDLYIFAKRSCTKFEIRGINLRHQIYDFFFRKKIVHDSFQVR